MNRTIQKTAIGGAAFLLFGCAFAASPRSRLTREDIKYATEHGAAVVEAKVGAGERQAIGTRSEGYRYPLRVVSVLLPATAKVQLTSTYDYRKEPVLRPGHYVLILQPGPYYRAERVSLGSARITELRQWTQHHGA